MTNLYLDAVFLLFAERHAPEISSFFAFEPTVVKNEGEFQEALLKSTPHSLWVCHEPSHFGRYLKAVESDWLAKAVDRPRSPVLLSFDEKISPALDAFFHVVVARKKSFLRNSEIVEVLRSNNAADLVLGGEIDRALGLIKLLRGDLSTLIVPLAAFAETAAGVKAKFDEFEVTDHGQSLRFGPYEAAVDAVLYEYDPEFRRRQRKRLAASERSFGASLRRLRLQRGLTQADFPGLTGKEIGRIERGEVKRPHGKTLEQLAKVLKVEPGEIQTF